MEELSHLAHHSALPEREDFQHALAMILSNGHTLTCVDIQAIMPHYGYKATTSVAASQQMDNHKTRKALAVFGVELEEKKYLGTRIFSDGSIPEDKTDLGLTYAVIDERRSRQNR